MAKHKDKILELRAKGYSYLQIQMELGCSKGTICYHLGQGQKEKNALRRAKRRDKHVIEKKSWSFQNRTKRENPRKKNAAQVPVWRKRSRKSQDFQRIRLPKNTSRYVRTTFSYRDVEAKFGLKPQCYLTGRELDLTDPDTCEFDHIKPVSRGGDNSFDNLGLLCPEANNAKGNMLVEEFVSFCKEVLEHQGYTVSKRRKE